MQEYELLARQAGELSELLIRHKSERANWESVNGRITMQRFELASIRGVRFLVDLLSSGPVSANEVKALAHRAGLGRVALQTAKRESGVLSWKRGPCWFWELPVQN
jgi:hypothetical protein